nr:reverse transcriptase domain-containing protein [Tanacetum cinerariifolium]
MKSLTGFTGEKIWPIGQIRLLVIVGNEEHSTRTWMTFMVIRSPSPYNGIIGRLGISAIRARNLDIFAWEPKHITGVPHSITEHKLKIRQGYSSVRQKKQLCDNPFKDWRERAAICEAKAKSKMKGYYDAKVRGVSFRPGDFVYRANAQATQKMQENLDQSGKDPMSSRWWTRVPHLLLSCGRRRKVEAIFLPTFTRITKGHL